MSDAQLRVRDLMTTVLFTLRQGQSISLAETAMRRMRIRHIPVVDNEHRLVGIVTHRDLLTAKLSAVTPLSDSERSSWELKIPVAQIMQRDVWTVSSDALAVAGARLLRDHKFGCLPVVDENRVLLGIVTEHDFLRLITESLQLGRPPEAPTARSAMVPAPYFVTAINTVGDARKLMTDRGIRHLPVVDEHHHPVGMVSERDLQVAAAIVGGIDQSEDLAISVLGTERPYTVQADSPLGPILLDMATEKIGSAMVVEEEQLIGIITSTDACRMLGEQLTPKASAPPRDR